MRGALIPYAGSERPRLVSVDASNPASAFLSAPPLASTLTEEREADAVWLFRTGLDTVDIARKLQCTPAAAANALARARDRERGQ